MNQNIKNAGQNLASDIYCLLGKCKNKNQEDRLKSETNTILTNRDFESKQYVDDPFVQMRLVKNSDKDIKIGENGGAVV